MKNGYKTTSDLPKVEEENMIKLHESKLNGITKCAFIVGMICGSVATMLLIALAEIIKMFSS